MNIATETGNTFFGQSLGSWNQIFEMEYVFFGLWPDHGHWKLKIEILQEFHHQHEIPERWSTIMSYTGNMDRGSGTSDP
jgi:hypothetical protein